MSKGSIEGFRLAPQQKRLWSLERRDPVYRAQLAILLEGPLEAPILWSALQSLVERHGILRTTVQRRAGVKTPLQMIAKRVEAPWRVIDISDRGVEEREAIVEDIRRRESRRVFDFERGPLIHALLLRLAEDRRLLLLTLPALCADAWSLTNLVTELSAGYVSQVEGQAAPEEPTQYLQFSEWQNELLEGEEAEPGRAYWSRQDFSVAASLTLPFERSAEPQPQFDPVARPVEMGAAATAELEQVAERCQASLTSVLLAAWQALLWRVTAQRDVVVGAAFNCREYEELKGAVGPFARYLPIESRLEGGLRFRDFVKAVDANLREAAEWQDYFPDTNEVATPFTSFCFAHEEEAGTLVAGGARFSVYRQYVCDERYKVKLRCAERDRELRLELYYDAARFSFAELERLGGCYAALLRGLSDGPERTVDELDILNAAERHRASAAWNDTDTAYPDVIGVHELFEAQANKTPDAIAVVFEDEFLTYRALDSRANQLARRLREMGVGPEARVGLYVDRGLDAIVGILGVLKAGGAYVQSTSTAKYLKTGCT